MQRQTFSKNVNWNVKDTFFDLDINCVAAFDGIILLHLKNTYFTLCRDFVQSKLATTICHSILRWNKSKQSFANVLHNRCSEKSSKFHWKTSVLESLFNKVAGLKTCNIIKKRLQHRHFPAKFVKFLRTPVFTKHLRWLLLNKPRRSLWFTVWQSKALVIQDKST